MFIFDSRFAWSDLCSRTLSSMICLILMNKPVLGRFMADFYFLGQISPNFELKNMISNYTKGFPWKKRAKFSQISRNKIKSRSPIFYDKFHKVVKNIELLSYLICSQIWQYHPMDDPHFSFITKLKKKPGIWFYHTLIW